MTEITPHLHVVTFEPQPIPPSHSALAAAKLALLEASESLRAASSALGTVSLLDPAYGCAASSSEQVSAVQLQIAAIVEHLDNRGVA